MSIEYRRLLEDLENELLSIWYKAPDRTHCENIHRCLREIRALLKDKHVTD